VDRAITYGTALETIVLAGRMKTTSQRWAEFEDAANALAAAAVDGDLARVARETGRIALLSHDRARSHSDPHLVEQPRRAREAAAHATKALQPDPERQKPGEKK
jgi:hypothetical protein